jgi:primosomal protein DnaI
MSSSTEKLITEFKKHPLLKGIELTKDNIRNACFYVFEKENCANCKGLNECKNSTVGIESFFDGKEITYKSCRYLMGERRRGNVNHSFASNYLADANFKNFDISTEARAKVLQYGLNFLENPKNNGLYIYGNFCTGKTYFLSALANELAQKDVSTIIVFMPDLSRDLKNAMHENSLEEKVNALKNVDVLMLDDLGGEMMSSWLRDEIIAPIIQFRLVNKLPIFITSNLDYPKLVDHFEQTRDDLDTLKSSRIISRIKSMTKRVLFNDTFK